MSIGNKVRFVVLLIGVVVGLAVSGPASAVNEKAKYAALVMDAGTGRVLYESNADARRYPASLTKMMTLYMAFEALEQRRWSLNGRLPVTARATAQPPSKLGLRKGQTITVKNAILALVTKSANDIAVVLAEGLGGTESRFAAAMTRKARQLGMSRTTFRNASGLPDPGQVTTARDMAMLAIALMRDFPQYYHYFSTRNFSYRGATYRNHNGLLGRYDGVDGIKTGYIRASGFNLVASARRGGRRIIGVVFGGKTAAARNSHMASLLDDGFRSLKTTLANDVARPRIGLDVTGEAAFPSVPTALQPAGTWAIQVGAYSDARAAEVAAKHAAGLVPALTRGAVVHVEPGRGPGKSTVYQARIANVGRQEATRACRILSRKSVRCMTVKLSDPVAVASASLPSVIAKPSRKPGTSADAVALADRSVDTDDPIAMTIGQAISGQRARTNWAVQVGAYRDPKPALAMASAATKRVAPLLEEGHVAVLRRPASGRSDYYLAQVQGLTERSARTACVRLRRSNIDCLTIETASGNDDIQVGWDRTAVDNGLVPVSTKPAFATGEGDWGIQVGAFPRSHSARTAAAKAVKALPDTLEPGVVKVVPLTRKKRGTVYRARIVGIKKSSAYQACRLLELKKVPCMVLRDKDPDLASAS